MEEKKLSAGAAVSAGVFLVLNLLTHLVKNFPFLPALNTVFSPLLLIAAVVCGYFARKEKVAYPGKAIWIVLAVQLGMTAKYLEQMILSLRGGGDMLAVTSAALYVAGSLAVLLSLLSPKLSKFLAYALGILAAGALIGSVGGKLAVFEILLYVALAILSQGEWAEYKYILRIGAVALAVASVTSLGIMAATWIVLAYVLLPARKCTCKLTLEKIAAVLCALTAMVSLGLYVVGEPVAAVKQTQNQITAILEGIEEKEELLIVRNEDIIENLDNLTQTKQNLDKAKGDVTAATAKLEEKKADLKAANAALDLVCTRTSYYWRYCTDDCRPLHDKVTTCEDAVTTQESKLEKTSDRVVALETRIATLEENVATAQQDIAGAKADIAELTAGLDYARSQVLADWFVILIQFAALVLSVGALWIFVMCLFKDMDEKLLQYACYAMGVGALLFLVASAVGTSKAWYCYFVNPYLWTVLIAVFLALVLTKTVKKPNVFRLLSILAALLVGGCGFTAGVTGIIGCALFALAMICLSFALIPLEFTEYNRIAKHIFLSFVTFGIWQILWVYNVTKNLNKVPGTAERKPVRELLLSLFLPFYYSYWLLKTGENVERYGKERGKDFKLDTVCLAFAFICPLVSTVVIQNKINLIVGKPE